MRPVLRAACLPLGSPGRPSRGQSVRCPAACPPVRRHDPAMSQPLRSRPRCPPPPPRPQPTASSSPQPPLPWGPLPPGWGVASCAGSGCGGHMARGSCTREGPWLCVGACCGAGKLTGHRVFRMCCRGLRPACPHGGRRLVLVTLGRVPGAVATRVAVPALCPHPRCEAPSSTAFSSLCCFWF